MKTPFLIFDFDGTIANTIPPVENIVRLFNKISKDIKFNKTITKQDVERLREKSLREIVKELHIRFFKLPFIIKKARKELKKDLETSNPFPGIVETLLELKKMGLSLGIITSSKKEDVENFLKRHKLNVFSAIHSESNLFGKSRAISHFLKKQNLQKDDVIYIGDEIRDIDAARKSGIKIISVTWGFNGKKGLLKRIPDFLIDTQEELLKIFKPK